MGITYNFESSFLAKFAQEQGLCMSVNESNGTTKEFEHSYLSLVYQDILGSLDFKVRKLLEIGVSRGSSLEMWRRLDIAEEIFGIEPNRDFLQHHKLMEWSELTIIWDDAYRKRVYGKFKKDFSLIIDDGPHTPWSQLLSLRKYPSKLERGGFYVLEDIGDIESKLVAYYYSIPRGLRKCVYVFDLRDVARNKELSVAMVVHACPEINIKCKFESINHIGKRVDLPILPPPKVFLMLLLNQSKSYVRRIIIGGIKYRLRSR
jgi:hypothetical protein